MVGDEVMGQVPVLHPMYLQYRYPPTAPSRAPKRYVQLSLIIFIFTYFYVYETKILIYFYWKLLLIEINS